MAYRPFILPGHSGKAKRRGHGNLQIASEAHDFATGNEGPHSGSDGETTSGPLVMANGSHIFFEEDRESPQQDVKTPDTSGALQVRHADARTGRESPAGTPSARSIGTSDTLVASSASSVTMPDSSEWEYLQRHTTAVDPTRMNQIQLFNDFLEMHFPSPAAKADLATRKSYLMGLPEIDLSSAPMLRSAVEAICYAHAGANYKDQRLVQASRKAYGKVLGSLVRCLNSNTGQKDSRIIVPSIMLLTLYDDALPEAKSTDWRAHYWGVHDYLRATGPAAFLMSEPFSRMLFVNLRVPTIFLGIARRKAVVLSEPQWQMLGNLSGMGATSLGRLYPLALRLPGLLERTDAYLRKNSYAEAKPLMRDLMALRGELVTWSTMESSFADRTIAHSTSVDTTDDSVFDFDIEEHLVMSANTTFPSLFDFASYKVAQDYALYWIFALILDCALLRLMHFRPDTESYIRPRTRAETERDAAGRARYLCRSAYFFSKFDSQGITSFLDTIVALAESLFVEIEAVKELGWCQSVRVAIQMRLARLRGKQPKTLCRMGDMVADLAAATRFKSRIVVGGT